MTRLDDIKKAYFIGIGGIGMSAIARYFHSRGIAVFGYDKTLTELTQTLENEGIVIHYEDDLSQIPEGIDVVVYTPAVPASHKELVYFQENNYPVFKRAAVLGMISRSQKVVGIAGTHGKTTTSTITTHLLKSGGVDCSAFLGGIALDFQSNYVNGDTDIVVVEADEFDRSFLHLHPQIAVVMSVDADHLDIYGTHAAMQTAFHEYAEQTQPEGLIFYKAGLPLHLQPKTGVKVQTFGIETGDFQAKKVRVEQGFFTFDLESPIENIAGLQCSLPGKHNIENALAAIAVAQSLGVEAMAIRAALRNFRGIKRRFEFVIREENKVLIDDYAHHPTELEAAITAARTLYPNERITGVFQPHLYSRTRDFAEGFSAALSLLDEVVLLDIYPARELPIKNVTAQMLLDAITTTDKKVLSKEDFLAQYPTRETKVLLMLGAGDIDALVEPIRAIWLKIK